MQRSTWLRRSALIAAFALAATACGGDDPATVETPEATDEETTEDATPEETETPFALEDVAGLGDQTLTLARVLPETGALGFLGGPMIAGFDLAIDDINAGGGVFGKDVEALRFDSATDPTVALPNVNTAFAQGADALIGAGASSITLSTLDGLSAEGIPSCTPSATSGDISTARTAEKLYRTVPSDEFVVGVIADTIVSDGAAEKVVIAAQQDAYGNFLAEELQPALEGAGVPSDAITTINFDPAASDLSSEAGQIAAENPTAIILVSFDIGGVLLRGLIEEPNSIDPSIVYGADGVFSSQLPDLAGVSIDGMQVIGAAGSNEFNQRLSDEGVNDFIYGGQSYDCTILMALWAVAEGNDDTSSWDPQTLLDLSDGGEKCTTFQDCVAILEADGDVDYDGASGPLNLQPGNPDGEGSLGEPTVTTYAVARFENGALTPVSSSEVNLLE